MSHRDVIDAVSPIVPIVHMEWPNDSAPPLPWATYSGDDKPIGADNEQIAVRHRWTVELYEARRDKKVEKDVADALRERFGTVSRDESYIEKENLLMVAYTFYQIEGEYDG